MIQIDSIDNFPSLPGIYKFTNKINGKIYIGESLVLSDRMNNYKNSFLKRDDQRIYRAFKKYRLENFSYFLLEVFPIGTEKAVLLEREKFWISFYQTTDKDIGYNICPCGFDNTGIKRSLEWKKMMSEKMKGKPPAFLGRKHTDLTRKKISEAKKGKRLSIETRKKMSLAKSANPPMLGKIQSKETRRKISESKKGENHPMFRKTIPWFKYGEKILQIDKKTGKVIRDWSSSYEAARNLFEGRSVDPSSIREVVLGKRKSAHGFFWRKCDE